MQWVFTCVVLSLLATGWALECPTCQGEACDGAVPVVECTKNIPKLPFKLKSKLSLDAATDYGCLDLEYFENGELQQIRQCHLVSKTVDLCKDIRKSLNEYAPLVTCALSENISIEPFAGSEGSGDGDDDGDGGAVTHTLSIFALLAVVMFHLF